MRTPALLRWLPWLLTASLVACGADESMVAPGRPDAVADTAAPSDVTSPDATVDAGADTSPQDTTLPDAGSDVREPETTAPLFGLKQDERFVVPGNIARKTWPALAGPLVAWVEETDGPPALVVWDLRDLASAPRAFTVDNLVNPRELALSDAFLVYTDDRYGDPDVFALELETGRERPVVTRPGAQERPHVLGSRVAWEDCRACVTGLEREGRESRRQVYERDLAAAGPAGDERAVSASPVGASSPRYGLLADGRQALVWIEGRAELVVERLEAGFSRRWDVADVVPIERELASVALVDGVIAWRPRPLIVNPDSMIVNPDSMWPSDVFATAAEDGQTTALTVHAEIAASMPIGVAGLTGRAAWLEARPGEPGIGRLRTLRVGEASPVVDTLFELGSPTGFGLGTSHIAITAPRADNDGLEDLHLFALP